MFRCSNMIPFEYVVVVVVLTIKLFSVPNEIWIYGKIQKNEKTKKK